MDSMKKLKDMQKTNKVVNMPINFALNDKGVIKANSLKNVGLILEHDETLIHLFAFNEFTHEIEVIKDIPELRISKGRMVDEYDSLLLRYIEDRYGIYFSQNLLQLAVAREARLHNYNPVIDTLEGCLQYWDGKKRVDTFFPDYLGVEKSAITTEITKLFFVGAVAKVYEPKTKFDFVLDLVGGQGAGKTTLIQKMAMGWYTDQFTDFVNKDNYDNMLRSLIINDDEMTATANSSFEVLKRFITAQELEFRRAYGRNSVRYDKNFVMARTTNEQTYLKDKTGERRFLPLQVNKSKQRKHPVTDLNDEAVRQLWGEFVNYYNKGFKLNPTPAMEKKLEKHREQFMYVDEVEARIEEFLELTEADFVSSSTIAKNLGERNLINNRRMAQKIKYVMDNTDGWKYTKNPKRGYIRER